ncbi:MAG: hypothetical protein KDI74_16405 [Gammaproteobacteria bacterium]|nr:hypothetical protein [Gammaproteobacteria bacterium]
MRINQSAVVLMVFAVTGCSTVAPHYQASYENTQLLEEGGKNQVDVEAFTAADPKVNSLSIRAGTFQSPTNGSYVEYLQKALEQELYDARRLNQDSDIKVGGVLIENEIDASGFDIGTAKIKAEFIVRSGDREVYRKVHSAAIEWPSSFMANIAVPRAIKEYPRVVQELLSRLFLDPEFINALDQ